jgi:hypothetical protein
MKFEVKCINSISDETTKVIKNYEEFVKYLSDGDTDDIFFNITFTGDMFELEDLDALYDLEIAGVILKVKIGKLKFKCTDIIKSKKFRYLLKEIYKNLDGHVLNLTVKFTTQLKGKI